MSDWNLNMNRTAGICAASSERDSEGTLCRLCMKNNDYYYNIYTSNVACRVTVKDALKSLLGLEVAVGDGLPTTLCPLCLKKLTEFSVFKITCLESDAKLRKCSGINCFWCRIKVENKESQREENNERLHGRAPDGIESDAIDPLGIDDMCHVKVENEDSLREVNYELLHAPTPDGIESNATDPLASNDLFPVKEENIDPLREENDEVLYWTAPDGIESDAIDPLATDALPQISTTSGGEEVDAEGRGAIMTDREWNLVGAKKEPSHVENDDTEFQYTIAENGENWTMALGSASEAVGLLAHVRSPVITASASHLLAERNVRIDQCNDRLAHSASGALIESESGASHAEEGRNVIDKDLEKCGTIHRDQTCGSSRERVFSCSVCAKTYSQSSDLNEHKLTHTRVKSYSCEICEKNFFGKGHLNEHMRTHAKEKPYSCNICSNSYLQRRSLDEHMRNHGGEKPYSCDVCNKSFSRKRVLVTHCRTHTKEKPYSCYICSKSFTQRCNLYTHIRIHMRTHMRETFFM
ncbi:zinc finger protein 12-like [Ischnura elegans]|uniref:zinc finger protein 12-like n=1 Tax=Ischnura elegans TaxID=197161 RepID=UPI001ED8B62C|nr:zinc finger protein 12-like [Ischnura elegans]